MSSRNILVSTGFATVHPNNKLTINAVEAAELDSFSPEVRLSSRSCSSVYNAWFIGDSCQFVGSSESRRWEWYRRRQNGSTGRSRCLRSAAACSRTKMSNSSLPKSSNKYYCIAFRISYSKFVHITSFQKSSCIYHTSKLYNPPRVTGWSVCANHPQPIVSFPALLLFFHVHFTLRMYQHRSISRNA